jgi:predicted N-acetyltransferase YhbS
MAIEIRPAAAEDVEGISAVKQLVWSDEESDCELIRSALNDPNHIAFVAAAGEAIVGFVDGFMKSDVEGKQQWQVDLLAVHPEYRGMSVGMRLVRASVAAGTQNGAQYSRALIQVGNAASQRTFAKCGFQPLVAVCNLFITKEKIIKNATPVKGMLIIPVITFNYRGIWLENNFDTNGFNAAQVVLSKGNWQQASAVVPLHHKEGNIAAVAAGYKKEGQYQNWILETGS